jgi:hypothetical protein
MFDLLDLIDGLKNGLNQVADVRHHKLRSGGQRTQDAGYK